MTDPAAIRDIYERQAAAYDAERCRRLFEAPWLMRFADTLPHGARVLDLGCGAGQPISAWLIDMGFRLTGVDFSLAMLELARGRWPDEDWRHQDMRSLDLGEAFDGIISWDAFFHLTPDEQRMCIPRLAKHLKPGGKLLVTVGDRAGVVTGTVAGEPAYHASLSPAEYASLLETSGLSLTAYLPKDPECTSHSILMAKKEIQ